MNGLLLITSLVLLAIGGYAILGRNTLWEAHVRSSAVRGREPGQAETWLRNLLLGGVFFVFIAVLGLITVFTTATPGG
ncbi:MAG: hypothetical protein SF162_16110 [bacterium]|nr:hypothetical protein [bacterium]